MGYPRLIELPREVIKQPLPHIYPGGDCGPCVFGGVTGLTVREVYEKYGVKNAQKTEDKIDCDWYSFGKQNMRDAISQAVHDGYLDDYVLDHPVWFGRHTDFMYGLDAASMAGAWSRYMYMAFCAGFYGIACVNFEADGGRYNHWILLRGYRDMTYKETGGIVFEEILVSNSSNRRPTTTWLSVREYLPKWGGFDVMLVRPALAPIAQLAER